MDWAAEGLLEGLEGEERAARVELLDQLHQAGFEVDELREATRDGRLALLPLEVVLGQREHAYTARQVAQQAGIDLRQLLRIQQAFGLPAQDPDEPVFNQYTMRAAERAARFAAAGLPEDGIIDVSRVLGRAMAQVAEAMRELVAETVRPQVRSEAEYGLRLGELARELTPMVGPLLEDSLMAQLLAQVRSDVVGSAEVAAGGRLPGAREIAVGFADLVGFTRLGERRPVDELGAVATRLEELVSASVRPPVRVVKTIGDAAMMVSPEPPRLLDTALDLVEAADAEGEDFPQLHAGLAAGPAINRGGDWYGHAVNVASRVAAAARPGSVLVTRELREAAGDGYRFSPAGQRRLKGVRRPVRLYRARRADG
jgi:adenylate cyclase